MTFFLGNSVALFLGMRGRDFLSNIMAALFWVACTLLLLMIPVPDILAALFIGGGALLVVDGLVAGGITDPALLVLYSGAVLPVPRLVHSFAL